MERLDAYIRFIQEAEGLKSVTRTAWTAAGRRESTAEHTWRLTLLASLMVEFYPQLDRYRVLMLCLVHDLGELYGGDLCASDLPDPDEKQAMELEGVERLFSFLPERRRAEFRGIWDEYEAAQTPEARLVKALDKAETLLQHNQGKNPADFDYDFNLGYGADWFRGDPVLEELRRTLDAGTRARMEGQQ